MRRLPGPAGDRLGDGGDSRGSLRIVSGLAENTNSIFCDSSSVLEAANGCPVLLERRNHQPRGKSCAHIDPHQTTTRSPARVENTRAFLLTKTYMEGGDTTNIQIWLRLPHSLRISATVCETAITSSSAKKIATTAPGQMLSGASVPCARYSPTYNDKASRSTENDSRRPFVSGSCPGIVMSAPQTEK